jgi:hypothetical protein
MPRLPVRGRKGLRMTSRDYSTVQDLESFFADLTDKPMKCLYRGVEFNTVYVKPHRNEDQSVRGTHVWVGFVEPLSLDLRLETREGVGFEFPPADGGGATYRTSEMGTTGEALHRVFHWSATNTNLVLELLVGRTGETLLNLARSHHVLMDDGGIRYGPIRGAPREEAEALGALVRILEHFAPPRALSNQCPACGAPVDANATKCPSCDLSLA